MNTLATEGMSQFFETSALIFFRLLPIWVVSPIVMLRRSPLLVRVVLGLSIAFILSSAYKVDVSSFSFLSLAYEFLFGLLLAFGFHAAQGSIQTMGHIIDQQIGFSAATVFDPSSEQTQSLVGELLSWVVLIAFLSLDAHHALLRGIASTINTIPLGYPLHFNVESLFQIFGVQFALGFAIACPVILGLWLVDITLALVSRSLPQANIYFVAMPIKIGIGLLLMVWLTAHALPQMGRMFESTFTAWPQLFKEF